MNVRHERDRGVPGTDARRAPSRLESKEGIVDRDLMLVHSVMFKE
jgi:hypothetical protein